MPSVQTLSEQLESQQQFVACVMMSPIEEEEEKRRIFTPKAKILLFVCFLFFNCGTFFLFVCFGYAHVLFILPTLSRPSFMCVCLATCSLLQDIVNM